MSGRLVATLNIWSRDLIAVLKAEIQRVEGTPVWQQQLLINDCLLEDQEMLEEYVFPEMVDESIFYVTMCRRGLFIPAEQKQVRNLDPATPMVQFLPVLNRHLNPLFKVI